MWTRLTDGKRDIVIATKLGKAIRFSEKDVRSMGRTAAGVRGMTLGKKDEVIGMVAIGDGDKFIFTVSEKGYGKKTDIDLLPQAAPRGQGPHQPQGHPQDRPRPGHPGPQRGRSADRHRIGQGHPHQDHPGPGPGPGHAGRAADQPGGEGPRRDRGQGQRERIKSSEAGSVENVGGSACSGAPGFRSLHRPLEAPTFPLRILRRGRGDDINKIRAGRGRGESPLNRPC